MTSNFRKLEAKNSQFKWTELHQSEFNALKEQIKSLSFLSPFDVNRDMKIQVDASKEGGLGYMLFQQYSKDAEIKIITMASTGLTSAQRNYSATELELLGVVWALNHAKVYTTGNNLVEVLTDHSALET